MRSGAANGDVCSSRLQLHSPPSLFPWAVSPPSEGTSVGTLCDHPSTLHSHSVSHNEAGQVVNNRHRPRRIGVKGQQIADWGWGRGGHTSGRMSRIMHPSMRHKGADTSAPYHLHAVLRTELTNPMCYPMCSYLVARHSALTCLEDVLQRLTCL